ncbi:M23 family metallopeptidase [Paenibacillus tuaregi]|uniref:M23 family metallopeptidase n=1 Tax=Paenibacillus tuaregi TaxID=1816681 RepID=UPI000837C50F|nr:M23 family metallopeptidase [Paenibacillus tuaregi]
MKNAPLSRKMTLLVLQDANQSVKQIQVSKPLVITVPLVALLSISSLIVSLQAYSNHTAASLEQELQSSNTQLQAVVTDKEEAIRRLQHQLVTLTAESKNMRSQIKKVSQMENELQQIINKFGTGNSKTSEAATPGDTSYIGGEFIAVHDVDSRISGQATRDDYAEMSALIQAMLHRIPAMVDQAEAIHESMSGTPSLWPTLSRRTTSSFGYRTDPFTKKAAFHAGVDISGEIGDPIYSAGAGTVLQADHSPARGNFIIIQHPGGLQTWYMHLNKIQVNTGEKVTKGEVIGKLGSTGRSTGPHLHFQVVKENEPVDPVPYLN